jgi:N-acetylneuraminic acid mutarotase
VTDAALRQPPSFFVLLVSASLAAASCGGGAGAATPGDGGAGGSTDGAAGGMVPAHTFAAVAALTGPGRDGAVAFVVGGRGYVGTGTATTTGLPYFKDFWSYDPTADAWQAVAELPGDARAEAIAFAVGNYGYVGLGRLANGTTLADLWRYDPAADAWTRLADFPVATSQASSFVIDGVAYVIDSAGALRAYDAAGDTWTERMAFRGTARSSGVTFTVAGKGYFGTGFTDGGSAVTSPRYADLWQYDPAIDRWTRKTDLPTAPLNSAVGFSMGGFGYVGSGNDFSGAFAQFFRYDPGSDSWAAVATYPPGGANGMVAFVIGPVAYVGTGYLSNVGLLGSDTARFYRFEQHQ